MVFRLLQFAQVLGRRVMVGIVVERGPRGQKSRVVGARHGGCARGLQRITGQRVEFGVLLPRPNHLQHVGVVINGFDLLDFGQQGGVGLGLGGSQTRAQHEGGNHQATHRAHLIS